MSQSQDLPFRRNGSHALVRFVIAAVLALLVIPVGLVAIGSGLGLISLPFEMHLLDERMPVIFRVHMIASAGALLLIPLVISARNHRVLHKRMGRRLGAFVVAGGLTAMPVAIFSHSTVMARAGFTAQGIVWMLLLAAGIAAIRRGERERHVRLMLTMAAVTTGAVWFRVVTGSAIWLELPFETTYALAAWLCWLVPLAIVWRSDRLVQAMLKPARQSRTSPPLAHARAIV